ncbi:hypothetical protein NEOLI_001242 [Neolecta irregularis DAH-3]|uniref:Uncharacterized protein n=1 Tax=Neolecta irregularis (strain DAH-3) TaxID=1198029 RepID=A0A1U7LKB6_NEOID|nr:hypothetical protein NEOLI_001242 [Neolecta irregularis DAH-3]|eukprot:OLL23095.1 hypothetical protein NEOLI_001242 [Neolecta irregularis DAH-3]
MSARWNRATMKSQGHQPQPSLPVHTSADDPYDGSIRKWRKVWVSPPSVGASSKNPKNTVAPPIWKVYKWVPILDESDEESAIIEDTEMNIVNVSMESTPNPQLSDATVNGIEIGRGSEAQAMRVTSTLKEDKSITSQNEIDGIEG